MQYISHFQVLFLCFNFTLLYYLFHVFKPVVYYVRFRTRSKEGGSEVETPTSAMS